MSDQPQCFVIVNVRANLKLAYIITSRSVGTGWFKGAINPQEQPTFFARLYSEFLRLQWLKVSDVNGKMLVVSADFFHHLKPKIVKDNK